MRLAWIVYPGGVVIYLDHNRESILKEGGGGCDCGTIGTQQLCMYKDK